LTAPPVRFGAIAGPTAGCQRIIVPAYSYPSPAIFWDESIAAADPVQFMIANPANGPGSGRDSNYVAALARAKACGIRVMGYVDTAYGERPITDVNDDIAAWKCMYGVSDLFFDATASDAGLLAHFQDIADRAHATPGAIVMFNPGTNAAEGYEQLADILNLFEGSLDDYASFSPSGWVAGYPSARFSHLVYGVPDAAGMTAVLAQSVAQGAGYVYITSDTMPNPWGVLPPYWANEVEQITRGCAAGAG
jgi:hypothetical protein